MARVLNMLWRNFLNSAGNSGECRSIFLFFCRRLIFFVFTALHGMQTQSSDGSNSVCLSVRPSVRLSNAWIARPPGIPFGNSREFPGIADPQNSRREFPGISDILVGITGNFASFVFFPIFIVDYDILVWPPFKQNLEWRLWPNFLCL